MGTSVVLPYSNLYNNGWTSDSLVISPTISSEFRIPLDQVALINRVKLRDIALNEDKKYPYIEIKDINVNAKLISSMTLLKPSEFPSRARLVAHRGDILLSMIRPERGAIAIVNDEHDEYIVTNAIAVLTPKDLEPELLYFTLSSSKALKELGLFARGVAIPTLTIKQLENYKLPVSELSKEKSEIARELYNKWLDYNSSRKTLAQIINVVYSEELLSCDDNPHRSIKANYGVKKYDILTDRLDAGYFLLYDENTTEWNCPIVNLGEIVSFKSITDKPCCNSYFDTEIPILKIQNLYEDKLYVSINDVSKVGCEPNLLDDCGGYLSENDIAIPKNSNNINKSNVIKEDLTGAKVNQHIFVLSLNSDVLPEYLVLFLKSKWVEEQVDLYTSGIGQIILKRKNISDLQIPLPNINTQATIVNNVKSVMESVLNNTLKEKIDTFIRELIK